MPVLDTEIDREVVPPGAVLPAADVLPNPANAVEIAAAATAIIIVGVKPAAATVADGDHEHPKKHVPVLSGPDRAFQDQRPARLPRAGWHLPAATFLQAHQLRESDLRAQPAHQQDDPAAVRRPQ